MSIAGVVEQRSNRTFVPSLIRVLILPDDMALSAGEALSPDDRYLLVAGGAGAVVIDVRAAQHGARNPVLGVLSSGLRPDKAGAIETVITADDRYAFVS